MQIGILPGPKVVSLPYSIAICVHHGLSISLTVSFAWRQRQSFYAHDHVSDSLGDEHMNDFDATDMHDLYVDHEAFRHLLTRTMDLEKQVAGLNENISHMIDLFNQFMRQQAMSGRGEHPARVSGHDTTPPVEVTPTTNGMGGAGTSAGDMPLAGEDGTPYEGHLTKADTVALLKNMTPPVFEGEDRERNKDAVNTYLHKWNDLHKLWNTPNSLCAIESSLSLEGKAYKWYMSLSMAARTTTWSGCQEIFQKEFFPKNEQDCNWGDWDV